MSYQKKCLGVNKQGKVRKNNKVGFWGDYLDGIAKKFSLKYLFERELKDKGLAAKEEHPR